LQPQTAPGRAMETFRHSPPRPAPEMAETAEAAVPMPQPAMARLWLRKSRLSVFLKTSTCSKALLAVPWSGYII